MDISYISEILIFAILEKIFSTTIEFSLQYYFNNIKL